MADLSGQQDREVSRDYRRAAIITRRYR